jgi:hypothetical protein
MTEPDEPTKGTGELLGMPYDVRRPTAARVKSRIWNSDDPRMFPPKAFGWGYTINFYWLVHLGRYLRKDRNEPRP